MLGAFSSIVLCSGFIAAQSPTDIRGERSTTVAKLHERSSIYEAQLATVNKYKVSADPNKNAVTGKPIPERKKVPLAVPMADSLRDEMSNSFVIGGGYNHQRVDDLPVRSVQGVFVTGFYYPVSWIGFGGEYQYGRGTEDETVGNTRVRNRLTRHVGVFGPELSGYPGDRVRLFFHPLAGFAKERVRTSTSTASSTVEDTNFATQLGGGMDLRLTRSFVFRVFQFDYLGIRRSGTWQNNWRLATGVGVRGR